MSDVNVARRLIRRGNFRLQAQEFDDAVNSFEKALKYFPNSTEILQAIGKIKLHQGKTEDAIRYFREGSGEEPNQDLAVLIAYSLLQQNQQEQALELLSSFADLGEDGEILLGSLLILLDRDISGGINMLRPHTNRPGVFHIIGVGEHKLGNHSYAIRSFRAASGDWRSLHGLGVQQLILQSPRHAHQTFVEAKELYLRQVQIQKQDDSVINQLNFDIIATTDNKIVRKEKLEEYRSDHGFSVSHHLVYISTIFDLHGYGATVKEAINDLLTNKELDDNLRQLATIWLEECEKQ